MSKHSEACCIIPPIVEEGYEPKGKYAEINGLKTYITGPDSATTGILVFYDIFAFFPQTLQGADILAYSNSERPSRLFMPDFFKGNPMKIDYIPPSTPEQKSFVENWFKENLVPQSCLGMFEELFDAVLKEYSDITSWGVIGYCWGGKIVSLIGASDRPIKAAVQSSPAYVDPNNAAKVKIPMMLLVSKDEPADKVKEYEGNLTVTKHVETFGDQVHGWMSARGDLKDAKVKAEYKRGYKLAVDFFHDNF